MTQVLGPSGDEFDPASYRAVGMSAEDGRRWWRWRLTADQAQAWRRAGVDDPASAVQWTIAGAAAETVGRWRSAGLAAAEAILWHEYEFELDEAVRYKREGHRPDQAFDLRRGDRPRRSDDPAASGDAISGLMAFTGGDPQDRAQRFVLRTQGSDGLVTVSYLNQNWLDDEAIAWARHNVDATTAQAWQDLGLRPEEADRFIRRGLGPMAVARAWWRAGIPFEEAASWAGAGLTPEEAVEQRANGVTAEQAETLRILRREERFDDQ